MERPMSALRREMLAGRSDERQDKILAYAVDENLYTRGRWVAS